MGTSDCWLMTYTWKNILFHLWLPLRCYLPWLDHIKIISNHHAATCVLSTRSVGKFAEKLISCQGHFHYRGWLSLQGCYPVPVTLSTIQREYSQVVMNIYKSFTHCQWKGWSVSRACTSASCLAHTGQLLQALLWKVSQWKPSSSQLSLPCFCG